MSLIETTPDEKLCFAYCGESCTCSAKDTELMLRKQMLEAGSTVPEHWFLETYVMPDDPICVKCASQQEGPVPTECTCETSDK